MEQNRIETFGLDVFKDIGTHHEISRLRIRILASNRGVVFAHGLAEGRLELPLTAPVVEDIRAILALLEAAHDIGPAAAADAVATAGVELALLFEISRS